MEPLAGLERERRGEVVDDAVRIEDGGRAVVSQAGGVLLTETVAVLVIGIGVVAVFGVSLFLGVVAMLSR
ncbi:hypothetical protein [Streptomyces wuyuanensis]|uniref:hypothetical protein n=1 Tax=Streptomyces wuyuanensis TaxID=1196353 RepID=UPI0038053B08